MDPLHFEDVAFINEICTNIVGEIKLSFEEIVHAEDKNLEERQTEDEKFEQKNKLN